MFAEQQWQGLDIGGANPLLGAFRQVEERLCLLRTEVRNFHYAVMLFQKPCPRCHEPALVMIRDGLAACAQCGEHTDPTLAFQSCPDCESSLTRKTYHYWCRQCQHPVRSLYCFDARVFDAAYFQAKMQESRQRKRQREQVQREMSGNARSQPIVSSEPVRLDEVPGLEFDLNSIIAAAVPTSLRDSVAEHFDLRAYRQHLLDLADGCVVNFEGVSPLIGNARLDRIFRFITAIFLSHEGLLEIEETEGGVLTLTGK